jgi:hypothetical protein
VKEEGLVFRTRKQSLNVYRATLWWWLQVQNPGLKSIVGDSLTSMRQVLGMTDAEHAQLETEVRPMEAEQIHDIAIRVHEHLPGLVRRGYEILIQRATAVAAGTPAATT